VETNTADGSIASTVGDLATYLRMLMNGGRGPDGPLLTAESYERLTTPAIEVWPGGSYCYGLFRSDLEGHVSLGHGGGMPGFSSAMRSDLDSGFGAVVFVNGPGRPDDVARYALALLRASAEDAPLPDPPREERPDKAALAAYVGAYRNGDQTLRVVERGEGIGLALADGLAPLEPLHDDTFAVDHPDWERFTLGFGRDGERIVEAWHGGEWWAGDGYAGPTEFEVPAAWHAYPGHYRSHNPWATNFRVVIRKGELWLLVPGSDSDGIGEQEHLVPIGDPAAGLFRIGDDERSPERLQFSAIVEGRALLARLSGADYARFFTP
jgi:hypothetical protein